MKNWQRTLIGPETTLRDALQALEQSGVKIALVVDASRRLLGTLSDGDVRRGLLRGLSLTDRALAVMNQSPACAAADDDRHAILSTMRRAGLHQIPVVDRDGVVVGLEVVDDFLAAQTRDQWVVVMAGGVGKRLQELTRETPKPMLKVGNRPLLETVVRAYADQGFRRFYIAVNYKAEQIESHFGDGSEFGVDIRYIREQRPLGTAGALGLLPTAPSEAIVVTNADLLTKEDYGYMVDAHLESGAAATLGVRDYEMQVPFGVVHERDGRVELIEEKPVQRFVVSAGMYVLSPEVIALVPRGQAIDMPTLLHTARERGLRTRCHHINGYWLDIGHLRDYERANSDFAEMFR